MSLHYNKCTSRLYASCQVWCFPSWRLGDLATFKKHGLSVYQLGIIACKNALVCLIFLEAAHVSDTIASDFDIAKRIQRINAKMMRDVCNYFAFFQLHSKPSEIFLHAIQQLCIAFFLHPKA